MQNSGQAANAHIAAIVPAYNERGRLKSTLELLIKLSELDEIIVVDDGSSDGTACDIDDLNPGDERIRCIRLENNQGKSRAMQTGAGATACELILFLDADLYHIKLEDVRSLIRPVRDDELDMAIGVFQGGKWNTDLSHWASPWLSGQRCMLRSKFLHVPFSIVEGYGIEIAMTVIAKRERWRYRYLPLRGAYHKPSEFHRGGFTGIKWRMRMYGQIIRTYLALRRSSEAQSQ